MMRTRKRKGALTLTVVHKPTWREACLAGARQGPPCGHRTKHADLITDCPRCGGQLYVVEYVLTAIDKRCRDHSQPMEDGFHTQMAPDNLKDCSTDQEKVECDACGERYTLGDLTYD